jgi:hypothetical protein
VPHSPVVAPQNHNLIYNDIEMWTAHEQVSASARDTQTQLTGTELVNSGGTRLKDMVSTHDGLLVKTSVPNDVTNKVTRLLHVSEHAYNCVTDRWKPNWPAQSAFSWPRFKNCHCFLKSALRVLAFASQQRKVSYLCTSDLAQIRINKPSAPC